MFRREPTVELPKAFEAELEDVTLSGVSFQAAAQDIFSRVLGVGRHGVLVDWSDTNARPYWSRYDAPSITNWMDAANRRKAGAHASHPARDRDHTER